MQLSSKQAQVVPGMNPKHVKIIARPRQEPQSRTDHPDGRPSAGDRRAEAERVECIRGIAAISD